MGQVQRLPPRVTHGRRVPAVTTRRGDDLALGHRKMRRSGSCHGTGQHYRRTLCSDRPCRPAEPTTSVRASTAGSVSATAGTSACERRPAEQSQCALLDHAMSCRRALSHSFADPARGRLDGDVSLEQVDHTGHACKRQRSRSVRGQVEQNDRMKKRPGFPRSRVVGSLTDTALAGWSAHDYPRVIVNMKHPQATFRLWI
jgi:hypothetical protein